MNKNNIVSLIVVAIIAISSVVYLKSVLENAQLEVAAPSSRTFGASGSGQNTYSRQYFDAGLTQGGVVATSSTATTYKLSANDLSGSVIQWTPNVNVTLQVGSSTGALIPKAGDMAKIEILNASSTAGSSITFSAVDANVDLQFTEATGGDLVLNGLDWAELTFIRQVNGKITVLFNEFTEAD